MQKRVLTTIKEHNMLTRGDGVVIGLSGGADSVALTHFLCNLPNLGLKIVCVHMHHGLRGREADEDADFCADFCRQLGVDLITFNEDAAATAQEMGIGVEEAGRILRYNYFTQILQQRGCNRIAVAHNQNDNAETIIMQIARGAGAVRGIPPINGNVIRPLADVSREEILAYCARHDLAYRTDSTNNSLDYTRNWVRNFLLPQIEGNLNPSAREALCRLAKISSEENAFLDNITKNSYSKCVKRCENGLVINLRAFAQHDVAIKRRIVRFALGEALGNTRDTGYDHVDTVLALEGHQSGKQASLPKDFVADRTYHEICIRKPKNHDSFSITLSKNSQIFVPQINSWVRLCDAPGHENAFTKALDCGKITDGVVQIRSRLPGDKIYFNSVGTKKIKDFFTDKKITRDRREKAVFIAHGQDIILIMGEDFKKPIESDKFTPNPENNSKTIYLQIWKNCGG